MRKDLFDESNLVDAFRSVPAPAPRLTRLRAVPAPRRRFRFGLVAFVGAVSAATASVAVGVQLVRTPPPQPPVASAIAGAPTPQTPTSAVPTVVVVPGTASATVPQTPKPGATAPSGAPVAAQTAAPVATPHPSNVVVEAETFVPEGSPPSHYPVVRSDSGASGARDLVYWWTASAGTTASVPQTSQLALRVRGDQCEGAPLMVVSIDGTALPAVAVTSPTWTTMTLPVNIPAGNHHLTVAYTNDVTTSACDRNLRVDQVTFVAVP